MHMRQLFTVFAQKVIYESFTAIMIAYQAVQKVVMNQLPNPSVSRWVTTMDLMATYQVGHLHMKKYGHI